jgi:hypothetical protein
MSTQNSFALLGAFQALFDGRKYKHRNSTLGDQVALLLYDDLVRLGKSQKLTDRIQNRERVVNLGNRAVGKKSRRGDGAFGELVPSTTALPREGFLVAGGEIANIEIGAETKILAKSMIKQIDRVIGDLLRQVDEFKHTGGNPICIGIVGINFASEYTAYEGERAYPTDGRKHKHPIQEASDAESRVAHQAKERFDEFQFLRFRATNASPFPFEWVNYSQTINEYSALLLRLSREYDRRYV